MKPGFETASSSKAAHEIMGLLLVLSSLSAPKRAPTVWTCGSALWLSVCRMWFCSVIFLSPFPPCFSRGKKRRGVPLPAAGWAGGAAKDRATWDLNQRLAVFESSFGRALVVTSLVPSFVTEFWI